MNDKSRLLFAFTYLQFMHWFYIEYLITDKKQKKYA